MMTGAALNRFENSAYLRCGAQMHAFADLGAGTDQRVRIDHAAFIDVGAPPLMNMGGMQMTEGAT